MAIARDIRDLERNRHAQLLQQQDEVNAQVPDALKLPEEVSLAGRLEVAGGVEEPLLGDADGTNVEGGVEAVPLTSEELKEAAEASQEASEEDQPKKSGRKAASGPAENKSAK